VWTPSSDTIRRRFDALLLASASIVWWTDAKGEFVEEQPYWAQYTGKCWEEYRNSAWIDAIHPADRDTIVADWSRAVSTISPYYTQGRIWSAKHKAYRAFQTRGIPIKNDSMEVEGWLGALTDIQDSIDLKVLLDRTEEDLAETLTILRANEAQLAAELETTRKREEQIGTLLAEINHRSKNLFTVVIAIARQMEGSSREFMNAFEARINALSASYNLLINNTWRGAEIGDLVKTQLVHVAELLGTRVRTNGVPLFLSVRAAQALGMAFHELATNAIKHGALGTDTGTVDLGWRIDGTRQNKSFGVEWVEHGTRAMSPPCLQGFGSKVLGSLIESTLGGTAVAQYRSEGFVWRFRCPLSSILENQPHAGAISTRKREPSETGPKVIIIEDEFLVALETERTLREAGMSVVGVTARLEDALSLCADVECDLVILDVQLGDQTSERVAEALRARGVPFLILTAYSQDQLPKDLQDAPYHQKPMRPVALINQLRALTHSEYTNA
jgi:two-component sensor histidine kinase